MKIVLAVIATLLTTLIGATNSLAEITWDVANSQWNGEPFEAIPGFPGVGMTTGAGVRAYGFGTNTNGTFVFGFANQQLTGLPTHAQTDLFATVLTAGTELRLVFTKLATDKVNFVAFTADGASTTNSYDLFSDTAFRIITNVADPVASSNGDVGAAFGLVVSYGGSTQPDFRSSMFVTDMHFLDIQPPAQLLPGLAGISGSGVSGTSANFYAFMPLPFLQSFGLTEATVDQVQGYVDGIPVPTGDFENLGLRSDLGFGFNDPANPNNTVLKVHVRNGSWSTRTTQFGRLDQSAPALAVTSKRVTKKSPAKVLGTATDASGVASVEYSSKANGPFKSAKLSAGTWSFKLPIKNGKSAKAFVRATDVLGNVSQPIVAKVKLK